LLTSNNKVIQESEEEALPKTSLRKKVLSTKTVSLDDNREEELEGAPSKDNTPKNPLLLLNSSLRQFNKGSLPPYPTISSKEPIAIKSIMLYYN